MLVSKRKRYLSGSDWVINTLDRMMKSATCVGNISQIVLQLDSTVQQEEVRNALNRFVKKFPVIRGRGARDIRLAPYWKIPRENDGELSFHPVVLDNNGPLGDNFSPLEKSANAPFRDKRDYLSFQLLQDGGRNVLSMTFDHRLFDARGAEGFLNLFQQDVRDGSVAGDIAFVSSAALTQWSRKFRAGQNVNRRIIALSKSTPEQLPLPREISGAYRYRLISFTPRETEDVLERAYHEAGYLMESLFLLAVIVQALHDLFIQRYRPRSSYLIPVTVDLRPNADALQEIFFNYVSYLFYQIPVQVAGDRQKIIASLKQQMYDQVKAGFPKDLAEASQLTRIAPPSILGRLLHLPLEGKMATFAFSHLGKSSYQYGDFMGVKIENLFHMPRVPVPPGLGFFTNYFNGRLNIALSHIDGLLKEEEVQMLEAGIRARCGVPKT
ncbi:MAG TPA: hypothetical protein VL122_03445 [Nitrospirota bacterium]|nr:hypothetical protein [Nitrospirota bacterium]